MAEANRKVSGPAVDGLSYKQLLGLLKEMRATGVSYVELPGVKITLAPQPRTADVPPHVGPVSVLEARKAFDHAAMLRQEQQIKRKQQLSAMKAGGTGLHTGTLVEDIFQASLETKG